MTGTGTASRRRHGLAGLLVALFVVGGLIFSYGLGHAPVMRTCTAHDTGTTSPGGDHGHRADGAAPPGASSMAAPPEEPPLSPLDACLCFAVLLSLLLLGLAALPRRSGLRLPARVGWMLAPPARGTPLPVSLNSLQVLRL